MSVEFPTKWKFFNKHGFSLNAYQIVDSVTDEKQWFAELFFDRISVGLYDTEHIFVLEEYLDSDTGKSGYCYPRLDPTISLLLRWVPTDEKFETNIQLFEIDYSDITTPYINTVETLSIELVDGSQDDFENVDDPRRILSGTSILTEALQINIFLNSDSEINCDRMLEMVLVDNSNQSETIIGWFDFHGEVVGEDERFRMLLNNFGRRIDTEEFSAFRDVDINEQKIDYIKFNEKNKELLIAGDDIYNYIGTYRGLVNALNFFGYNDLKLKEYWLNIDKTSELYGTYRLIDVDMSTGKSIDPNMPALSLPNTTYKKTSKFGLFYDITKENGQYDEYGLPMIDRVDLFSNEEILIKLFSLKEILKKKFLPLNARIVDITGEGVWYESVETYSWIDQNIRIDIERPQLNVTFDVTPEIAFVEDVSTSTFMYDSIYFKSASQRIGAEVVLTNTTFEYSVSELTMSIDQSDEYTVYTINNGDVYEIEWKIVFDDTTKPFTMTRRGSILDMSTISILLPYVGTYTVILYLYDNSGFVYTTKKSKIISVLSKSSDFIGFCVYHDIEPLLSNFNNFLIDDLDCTVENPIYTKTLVSNSDIMVDTLSVLDCADQIPTIIVDNQKILHIDRSLNSITIDGLWKSVFSTSNTIYCSPTTDIQQIQSLEIDSVSSNGFKVSNTSFDAKPNDYIYVYRILSISDMNVFDQNSLLLSISGNHIDVFSYNSEVRFYMDQSNFIPGIVSEVVYDGDYTIISVQDEEELLTTETFIKIEIFYNSFVFEIDSINSTEIILTEDSIDGYSFIEFFNDINTNGNQYYCSWGIQTSPLTYSIIDISEDIETLTTTIIVDGHGLRYLTPNYVVSVAGFDVKNALTQFGNAIVDKMTIDIIGQQVIDQFEELTISDFDFRDSSYCGFVISKLVPFGTIRIDDGQIFSFSGNSNFDTDMAVDELNGSSIPEIQKFIYQSIDDEYIQAISKLPGSSGLAEIRLGNGLECNWCGSTYLTTTFPFGNTKEWIESIPYGQNNPPLWNRLYQTYYQYGEIYPPRYVPYKYNPGSDYNINLSPYTTTVDGYFSVSELRIFDRNVSIPSMSTLFVATDNSKIPQKDNIIWKLYNSKNILMSISNGSKFVWTFFEKGFFSLECTISDINGNNSTERKNNWIEIV